MMRMAERIAHFLRIRGPMFKFRPGDRLFWLWSFCGFPQSLQANSGVVPSIRPRPLPSISFSIHHLLIIRRYIVWATDSVVKFVTNNMVHWWTSEVRTIVAVEWLIFLFRNRKVPSSSLDPETDCPDWGLSWFFAGTLWNCSDCTFELTHCRLPLSASLSSTFITVVTFETV
jgi:hypothetical protein